MPLAHFWGRTPGQTPLGSRTFGDGPRVRPHWGLTPRRKKEPAVSRVLSWTTIHLGQPSPTASSNLPGSPLRRAVQAKARVLPYLALLQAGFTLPRCVATRAVRSYRTFSPLPAPQVIDKLRLGGIFSVALSMDSRPPGVTWRPARWSPDFPPAPSKDDGGCLADSYFLEPHIITEAGIGAGVHLFTYSPPLPATGTYP